MGHILVVLSMWTVCHVWNPTSTIYGICTKVIILWTSYGLNARSIGPQYFTMVKKINKIVIKKTKINENAWIDSGSTAKNIHVVSPFWMKLVLSRNCIFLFDLFYFYLSIFFSLFLSTWTPTNNPIPQAYWILHHVRTPSQLRLTQ